MVDSSTQKKPFLLLSSNGTGSTSKCTSNANSKDAGASVVSNFAETKEITYDFFTKAAQSISLTMGDDADGYLKDQKEDLKPKQFSIRISKKPKNLQDPRLRLWKLNHICALKMLPKESKQEEKPIDPALIARIQGAVFKTLRPRSIQMHMEARR